MPIAKNIKKFLNNQGMDFIHFVDISDLSPKQNKEFPSAILFGIVLSPSYINLVCNTPGYIKKVIKEKQIQNDEFHLTELKTDRIADELAFFLRKEGYDAHSQSEANIEASGFYDKQNNITPLPHKTIALMANMGWIGKHNLLVTKKYGCGMSMCSVLTNTPLKTAAHETSLSQCGNCTICVKVCQPKALTGNNWEKKKPRENVINIEKCFPCFECAAHCPWTQKYTNSASLLTFSK